MQVCGLTPEQWEEYPKKRHAFFSELAKKCQTIDVFFMKYEDYLMVLGMKLTRDGCGLSIYIQLSYCDYEYYYVVPDKYGRPRISNIMCLDDMCTATDKDIFSGDYADDEDIAENYDSE